jgi:GT2 family glycosyltransferase
MLHNSFYVIEKLSPDYIVMSALWKKYAVGSAFIIRSELFDDEKMFDERYFVYWEEVGLSLKIINQGYKICVLNNSVCI